MFVAKISESGSNKRAVENQVLALWLDHIQDIEGMYISSENVLDSVSPRYSNNQSQYIVSWLTSALLSDATFLCELCVV